MNILILNWKDIKNPQAGGAEIVSFEFAQRLVKKNHKVIFFSRKFKGCLTEEEINGVKVLRRGNLLTVYLHAYFYYKSLKRKPDRVIDMINTVCWQTPLYVPFEKRIAYINQLAKEVFFFNLPPALSLIAYLLERFEYVFYKNTKSLCFSQGTKDDLISFGINKNNVSIFPIGLDHTRYKKGGSKSRQPLFLFVGRLVKMKRVDICIKAMKQVAKKHPKAKLMILGNGPEEQRLEFLIKKLSLENNVFLVNKDKSLFDRNGEDLKVRLMQQAWALLLLSVKEGWGMVVTESAACGTPSIVSNVSGLSESVIPNKTGIVLSKNPASQELANAIIKIIEDKRLQKNLSLNSSKFAQKFSWEKSFNKFYKLL